MLDKMYWGAGILLFLIGCWLILTASWVALRWIGRAQRTGGDWTDATGASYPTAGRLTAEEDQA